MLLHQVSECIKLFVEGRDKDKTKLSWNLDRPDISPKTYWPIINKFLNNKVIAIIASVLFEGKLISDFE